MRIVYLDADFASATGETGPRSYAFARRLIARGHEVTILTSDRLLDLPADAGRVFRTTTDGIPVVAINVGLGRASSRAGRVWHHLRFAWNAARRLLRGERPEVVYVTSPPISAILPALLARWLRGVPYVLEVREIWPEVPRGIDLLRSRVLFFLLRRLAILGYRSAARVFALTEPAVHHIQADIPLDRKVVRIGACCDLDLFAGGDGTAIRVAQGWTDKFVCLHVGPMIRATGLESILRVADSLREDEQFVFWLVGGGEQRAQIERDIRDRDLRNVVVWDDVPRGQLPDVLAAADLGIMTMRRFRVLEQASSDRLFDYLAAGKPVLLNYSGWQREWIEKHGTGLGTPLGDHGQFFASICKLCDRPDLRAEMGRKARELAETACHPDHWAEKLEEVLSAVAGVSRQPDSQREVISP
jgi:glycosyltransferase involved in cell wall biosynthesis